jgi:hypothetical protein
MKKLITKLFGIDKLLKEKEKALEETKKAQEAEELAKMNPKERATKKGEPWVAVLETHVNKDNIRNGFFELDWNDQFITQLKQWGYGFEADPEEEIIDRWFKDLCRDMLAEDGLDTNRQTGYINVVPINKDKSEVS